MRTRRSLNSTIKDTSTIVHNTLPKYVGRVTLVMLRESLVPMIFHVVHPYIASHLFLYYIHFMAYCNFGPGENFV